MSLIKTCNLKHLMNIPWELLETFTSHLKKIWVQVQNQSSDGNIKHCSKEKHCIFCNGKIHNLAETIFRLSVNSGRCTTSCISEGVKRSIFGANQSDYEHFMLNYWENAPYLLNSFTKPLNTNDNIFNFFVHSFKSKISLDAILVSILQDLVSCPPLPSDELDILNFLKELKTGLAHPIIYGQDIRVVKAVDMILGPNQEKLKREMHFQKECTDSCYISDFNFNNIDNVQKCKIACQEGYTIALRGLEFRSEKIASVADGLAVLFGQPSVGVNAYLTPPRSQGLARHYDDHCVFICQLRGQKKWTVFPRSTCHLPRLYEPLHNLSGSEGNAASECKQFMLGEGDILYIPRGCPHEAFATADADKQEINNASTGFSFHLTLGIEVEPPFEWEGFAHVALHWWSWKNNQLSYINPFSQTMKLVSINLLHVAIHKIGGLDPNFAKACMAAAFSPHSETRGVLQSNALSQCQRTTFSYIVNTINQKASFVELLNNIEGAIKGKNEDMFQRMRWMRHLYPEGDNKEGLDWNNPIRELKSLILLCDENKSEAEAMFMQVKSNFCNEVIFEETCANFENLLIKYKRARREYMNGMLSLHCTNTIV